MSIFFQSITVCIAALMLAACGGQPTDDGDTAEDIARLGKLSVQSGNTFKFPDIYEKLSSEKVFVIQNTGESEVKDVVLTAPTGVFTWNKDKSNCSAVIAANSSCNISISFSPLSVGDYNSQMKVSYFNGLEKIDVNLSLTGTAVSGDTPILIGLEDQIGIKKAHTWVWACENNCEYRYVINQSSSFTFTDEVFGNDKIANQSEGDGIYYIHVQARSTISNKLTEVHTAQGELDNTLPSVPTNLVLQYNSSLTDSTSLSWTSSTDANSISGYMIAIGTTSGASDVVGFTSIGDVNSYQFQDISLNTGQDYYTSIKAVDGAGNESSVAVSAVWQVPEIPEVLGLINDVLPKNAKDWTWSCSLNCEYRFEISSSDTPNLSALSYSTQNTASLSSGDGNFYLHVQAKVVGYNTESLVKTVIFTLDNTNPDAIIEMSQADDATKTSSATLYWAEGVDNIGVDHYELAIGSSAGAIDISAWTNVGSVFHGKISGLLNLQMGVDYWTSIRVVDMAGNISSVSTYSSPWRIPAIPDLITDLAMVEASYNSVKLGWTKPNGNGSEITDYYIDYKLTSSATWLKWNDDISADTVVVVTGLLASTSYDFRVRAFNGNSGDNSNVLTVVTTPENEFFDPSLYHAMNLGGATDNSIVAFENSTEIYLNDVLVHTLNAGETASVSASQYDVLRSDKPFFVAGKYQPNVDSSEDAKGNMVWSTQDWAGKNFMFTANRNKDHKINIYAFENGTVSISLRNKIIASHTFTDVSTNPFHTFSITQDGGFVIQSDGFIIAQIYSNGAGDKVVDARPILPMSNDLIGFPSSSATFTSQANKAFFSCYYSDGFIENNLSMMFGKSYEVVGRGTPTFFQTPALRMIADSNVTGSSMEDGDGFSSTPFVPTSMMKKRFAVNVTSEYVAFASTEAASITVIESDGITYNLVLKKTGEDSNTPYSGRLTSVPAGTRFISTSRFQAWYEPAVDNNASDNDETILFGFD